MKPHTLKSGISLIAVLMFMLAATTASIVVYRHIGQENLTSGARLKQSEAQQASQAGFEAVQGWLTNKGADAGALIRTFEMQTGNKNPVLLISQTGGAAGNYDLLTGTAFKDDNKRNQSFAVYLIDANTREHPYKLKFMSVGEARDGSKFSQVGVFSVDGLYRMDAQGNPTQPPHPPNADKVPQYYGGMGAGTQGIMSSGYIIGDASTTSGFGTYGDLIVTGNYNMVSGSQVGCPLKSDGTRYSASTASDYPGKVNYNNMVANNPEFFGNAYIRENLTTQQVGYCGSVYVGGNFNTTGSVTIWGDLYVEGDLTTSNNFIVHGNLTVKGNINAGNILYVGGNLVMPNNNSTFNGGTTFAGLNSMQNPPSTTGNSGVVGTTCIAKSGADCSSVQGGVTLDYLGDQITTSKVDKNGNTCTTGADCMYRIPDPLVLGAAADWKKTTIPPSCTALNNYANNNVIKIDVNLNVTNFMNAVNACHSNGAVGNWPDDNGINWLVLRVDWNNVNNFQDQTFEGNIIIVVENKPGETIRLPLTTENTNVLLYLTKGANTIEMSNPGTGKHRNYFIYSEEDINTINGSQYLEGNIFMANGTKVNTMQDPKIVANDRLFEELVKAGVIKGNEDKCKGTGNDRGDGYCKPKDDEDEDVGGSSSSAAPPPLQRPNGIAADQDAMYSYVPTVPHLKVSLQSQYANEESAITNTPAQPAILVMPRIVYIAPKDIPISNVQLAERLNVLYLNGAVPPFTGTPTRLQVNTYIGGRLHCNTNISNLKNGDRDMCYLNLKDVADCNNSKLCDNAFYVVVAELQPSSASVSSSSSLQVSSSSSAIASSSSAAPSSSSAPAEPNYTVTCTINGSTTGVLYMKPGSIINDDFKCSTGETPVQNSLSNRPTLGQIPTTDAAGKTYAISGNFTCGGIGSVTSVCPTITVAGITCGTLQGTVMQGGTITAPTLTCNNGQTPSGTTWTPASWTVAAGATVDSNIPVSVTANCGAITGLQTSCGSVRVTGVELACSGLQSTVTQGGTIATPTLTCNNGTIASAITWTGRPNNSWNVPAADPIDKTYTITARATCGTVTKDAACGTVKVSNIPACTYQPSWCNDKYQEATNVPVRAPNAGNECFFVTSITQFCSNAGGSKINGVEVGQGNIGCWSSNTTPPAAKDGGYYIWVDNGVGVWGGNAGNGPACGSGGGTPSSSSAAVASSSSAAGSSSASGGGGGTPLTIPAGNSGGGVAVTTGEVYSVTCTSTSQAVWCNSGSGPFSATWNGSAIDVSGWNPDKPIANPCVNGAEFKITSGSNVSCRNAGSWY